MNYLWRLTCIFAVCVILLVITGWSSITVMFLLLILSAVMAYTFEPDDDDDLDPDRPDPDDGEHYIHH